MLIGRGLGNFQLSVITQQESRLKKEKATSQFKKSYSGRTSAVENYQHGEQSEKKQEQEKKGNKVGHADRKAGNSRKARLSVSCGKHRNTQRRTTSSH